MKLIKRIDSALIWWVRNVVGTTLHDVIASIIGVAILLISIYCLTFHDLQQQNMIDIIVLSADILFLIYTVCITEYKDSEDTKDFRDLQF